MRHTTLAIRAPQLAAHTPKLRRIAGETEPDNAIEDIFIRRLRRLENRHLNCLSKTDFVGTCVVQNTHTVAEVTPKTTTRTTVLEIYVILDYFLILGCISFVIRGYVCYTYQNVHIIKER